VALGEHRYCATSPYRSPRSLALGHARWEIENQGFNEAVNHWHTDHVYKHSSNAILTFWLTAMLAINIFHAFRVRNLKAEAWRQVSCQHSTSRDVWPASSTATPLSLGRSLRQRATAPTLSELVLAVAPRWECRFSRREPRNQPVKALKEL